MMKSCEVSCGRCVDRCLRSMSPRERREAGLVFVGSANAVSEDEALSICGGDFAFSTDRHSYIFLCFKASPQC